MDIQKELRKWADKTAKGYVSIANEDGKEAPSFYTQSDLTKIAASPKIIILGINPGSGGDIHKSKGQSQLGVRWKRYGWRTPYPRQLL